jgi:hypothetical protein
VINDPPLPFAARMTVSLKDAMDAAFSSGGNFTLKPGGSTVNAGTDGLIDIHVPITIEVPDWFEADMDIHIHLTISWADGHVFVAAPVVDPQVNWSLLSNLTSFGCTNAIGLGMPKIAYAFLERIVDEEVRPVVTQKIVDRWIRSWRRCITMMQQKRTFMMSTLIFSANEGLLITGFPQWAWSNSVCSQRREAANRWFAACPSSIAARQFICGWFLCSLKYSL